MTTIEPVAARSAAASVDAFDELPAWLTAAMDPDQVAASLRRHVPELASATVRLVGCLPERLRAKDQEWLARYRLTLERDGRNQDVVLVGNLWPPGRSAEPLASPTTPSPTTRTPTIHQPTMPSPTSPVPFGDTGWTGYLPDLRLSLRSQERDEALPALPRLTDPETARRLLQQVLTEAGYAKAVIAACTPRVVRYKPGSRCTIVVDVDYRHAGPDGAAANRRGPDPVVVKTHQGSKGQEAWAAMTALWARSARWRDAVRLAEPLGYLPEERVLVQGPVPEDRTLKELASRALADGPLADRSLAEGPLAQLRAELAKTARALAALHTCGARYGRSHTVEEELAEIDEMVARLAHSVPSLWPGSAPLRSHLARWAAQTAAGPDVSAHHDFRPAQVLLQNGGIGFIDFDGACMAEAALDLGRFRAKFRDIGIWAHVNAGRPLSGASLQDHLRLVDDLCDGFLADYQRHAPVSRDRVLLWETADLFTTMLHAWTKVRVARVAPRLAVLRHQLEVTA